MNANKAQERAIEKIDGQMILIACPGSGKTTTLIRRIRHMIESGITPESILMMTFTKAAAQEMKERYVKWYGENPGITFCTIHSLCLAILQKFGDYTSEDVLTEAEARHFFYEKLRYNKRVNDKEEFIKAVRLDISVLKNSRANPMVVPITCCDDRKLFIDLYQAYEDFKKDDSKIDYEDMLIYAYEKMKSDQACLNWLKNRYHYLQVDEYQDTNYLQRDIIYLLAGKDGNLAVVGDDDQSIYAFRGARPDVMIGFTDEYPNAEKIYMSTNYRSCSSIIERAAALITYNKERFVKDFIGSKPEKGITEIRSAETRPQELEAVLCEIKSLSEQGVPLKDIAVLFRTNKQSVGIAELLIKNKIPFLSNDRIESKYSHWMFRDIMAYHRLANGIGSQADLLQVLNHPQRYLWKASYTKNGLDQNAMVKAARIENPEGWKRNSAIQHIEDFFIALRMMKKAPPKQMINIMEKIVDYKSYLKKYAAFRNIDYHELLDIWEEYKKEAEGPGGNDWDKWEQFISDYNLTLKGAQQNKDGVVLSTMHRAKGLEWEHVILIDCVEGTCPFVKASADTEIEEERRLFYVAMTRAKKHLLMFYYRRNNKDYVNPSRFLEQIKTAYDIQGDLIKKIQSGHPLALSEKEREILVACLKNNQKGEN